MVEPMLNRSIQRRTVVKTSSRGRLYLDWEPMPRIPDDVLECVVYLYPSIAAANAGEKLGGSGFVVRVDQEGADFYYIVTNKHVIDAGSTTVRFNTKANIHEAFDWDERNWIRSAEADLAIFPFPDPPRDLKVRSIITGQFLRDETVKALDIGMGDDVFFAGRFVNAEGSDRNRPSLRFGNIAQTDTLMIDGEESYVVEARSIPGYSGSPVFVYTLAGLPRKLFDENTEKAIKTRSYGPFLLGVDWCHINDYVDARDQQGNMLPFKIRSNSGMMGVVPVAKLSDLLYRQDMVDMRRFSRKRDKAATPDAAAAGDSVSSPPANDANPTHREDFMRLVGAAAQKPEPKD